MQLTNEADPIAARNEWQAEQERKQQREVDARLRRFVFYPNDKRPAASDLSADGYTMWGSDLEKAQAAWDESRATWQRFEEQTRPVREAREAKVKADAEARAQREEAERAKAREELLEPARRAFLSAGGTTEEWDAQAPQIEAQIRQQRAVEAAQIGLTDDQIRSQRHFMRSF
jgi:hypothetical protein